jgi:flagellar biosynthesis component FlhA
VNSLTLPAWLRELRFSSEAALVTGVALVMIILIVPLPAVLLDAADVTAVTMVYFLNRSTQRLGFNQHLLRCT